MAERTCPPWLSFTLTNALRRMFHNPLTILSGFIKPGATVLDVGCGPGFFTIPMAKMVGQQGLVIATDISQKMLAKVKRRAKKAGLSVRIHLHLSERNRLGIGQKVDFALAFWMAHEVWSLERFFAEIQASLKPNGVFLLVEPRIHVPEERFNEIVAAAKNVGLKPYGEESIRLSRAVVFHSLEQNAKTK
jgi:ubiquinone/menaquinone biosynthesis C-methylase UbiE